MEINSEIAENFFGVYLLYCANPKYTGRTYIGYTVDPNRRIDKHNAGKDHGGARRTSNRGPWIMVLIVHGFFNNISALRFEWAWQHPHTSRRLKHIRRKRSNEKIFNYHLMILSEMLNVGPWCRLPLTLRWIDTQFGNDYSSFVTPPIHMPITYGAIIARKLNVKDNVVVNLTDEDKEPNELSVLTCYFCSKTVEEDEKVSCIKPKCQLLAHLICLADEFNKNDKTKIIPINGPCPLCKVDFLWGDLIRKSIGYYTNLEEISERVYENLSISEASDIDY